MDKSLSASKKLMKNYLSDLLTEEVVEKAPVETEQLNKLLQQATVTEQIENSSADIIVSRKSADTKIVELEPETEPEVELKEVPLETFKTAEQLSTSSQVEQNENAISYKEGSFQAMFFDVAGLTVAVPLIELGGIHNLSKTTNLMGKPDWFTGVMLHREEKINVVDTARWVMPEKYNAELEESLNYQFVIMLSESRWGLQAETLVDTVTLQPEDVKWVDQTSKRPWLAGLVKDRMCALLNVQALIKLLNKGINVDQV